MTDMKVKYGHRVTAPGNQALALEVATSVCDPHLFTECLGNRRLFGRGSRRFATTYTSHVYSHNIALLHTVIFIGSNRVNLYRFGIIIRPSIAAKKTTV